MNRLFFFGFGLVLIGTFGFLGVAYAEKPVATTVPMSASSQMRKQVSDRNKAFTPSAEDGETTFQSGKEKPITIGIGMSKTLAFDFEVGNIYLTDPNLFTYIRMKDGERTLKLRLIAKAPGVTDFTIYDAKGSPRIRYMVRVTREDVGLVVSQLEELLGDIEGLQIKPLDGSVILDGEILLPKDSVRIIRVLDNFDKRDASKPIPIKNFTTISKMTMNILANQIEREINNPEISVRVVNGIVFLEGTAESEFEADRAVEIARAYLPEAVVEKMKGSDVEVRQKTQGGATGGTPYINDMLRVRPRPMAPPSQDIKITMNYVELKNDYSKDFTFSWKPLMNDSGSSVKFDTSAGELSANFISTISSLIPKLSAARTHGHARILKQEQIIVKNKSEAPAVIESSIKQFIPLTVNGITSYQEIPIQNVTKVRAALIDNTDVIDLGLQITLNSPVGTGATPTIATNSLQTQVTIKNGDSAALGGYAIDNAVAQYNKDSAPPGQQGAPLFNLTRKKEYVREKQQYVIFVTPELIRTASSGTEEIVRKFRMNAGDQ